MLTPMRSPCCIHVCWRVHTWRDVLIRDKAHSVKWGSWMVAPSSYDSFICNMTHSANLKGVSRGNYGWTATFEIPRVRIKPNSAVVVVRQPWGVARKVSIRHSHLPPLHPRWYVRHDSLDFLSWYVSRVWYVWCVWHTWLICLYISHVTISHVTNEIVMSQMDWI